MSVKLHYSVFISGVRERVSEGGGRRKKTAVPTVTARLCPLGSRPLLCSLSQACWGHCAHWEKDEQGHTCLCGLGSKRGRGGEEGYNDKRPLNKTPPRPPPRSPWRCHGNADTRITLWNQCWGGAAGNWGQLQPSTTGIQSVIEIDKSHYKLVC